MSNRTEKQKDYARIQRERNARKYLTEEQKVRAYKERKIKNQYMDMISKEKKHQSTVNEENRASEVVQVKGGKESIRDEFFETALKHYSEPKSKKRDRSVPEEEGDSEEVYIEPKKLKTEKAPKNPFSKAQAEYQQRIQEKKDKELEYQRRQKVRKQKQKERHRVAAKLNQKTRKGQPVMNNVIKHIVEKLEKQNN